MQSPGPPRRRRRGGPGPAPGPPPAAGPGAPAGAGRGPRRCPEAPRLGKRGRGRPSFEGKTLSFSSENSAGFLRAPRDSSRPPASLPAAAPGARAPAAGIGQGEKGGPRAGGRALKGGWGEIVEIPPSHPKPAKKTQFCHAMAMGRREPHPSLCPAPHGRGHTALPCPSGGIETLGCFFFSLIPSAPRSGDGGVGAGARPRRRCASPSPSERGGRWRPPRAPPPSVARCGYGAASPPKRGRTAPRGREGLCSALPGAPCCGRELLPPPGWGLRHGHAGGNGGS